MKQSNIIGNCRWMAALIGLLALSWPGLLLSRAAIDIDSPGGQEDSPGRGRSGR